MADLFASRFDLVDDDVAQGSISTLFKVVCREDGLTYALKILDVPKHVTEDDDPSKEVYIQMALTHPNIVRCHRALKPDDGQTLKLGVLMEYCSGGNLDLFLKEREGRLLSYQLMLKWTKQLASAVEYLHDRLFMHRNLKPCNVLLDVEGNLKLGKFRTSRMLTSTYAKTVVGTPMFMAPEALYGEYDFKADIYSLGCVLLCMATSKRLPKMKNGEFYDLPDTSVYGEMLTDVIMACTSGNCEERPTARDIVSTLSDLLESPTSCQTEEEDDLLEGRETFKTGDDGQSYDLDVTESGTPDFTPPPSLICEDSEEDVKVEEPQKKSPSVVDQSRPQCHVTSLLAAKNVVPEREKSFGSLKEKFEELARKNRH